MLNCQVASSIFIVACDGQQKQLPAVVTALPIPSTTITPNPSVTPTKILTASITPISVYPPYQVKDVILKYTYSGVEGNDIFAQLASPHTPKLILYSDGLLIIGKDSLRQKVLTKQEIRSLFSQIKQMGFYSLDTNGPTDELYNFNNDYENAFDGRFLCISTKTKRICAYEPAIDYVIPSIKMRRIFKFLDSYSPSNTTPYQADRILLQVIEGSDYLPKEYKPNQIEWTDGLPTLQETRTFFVDGEKATKILALFDYSESWKIVTYKDKKYTVFARPVLPHEVIGQP